MSDVTQAGTNLVENAEISMDKIDGFAENPWHVHGRYTTVLSSQNL